MAPKLVRDRIPELILQRGAQPIVRSLTGPERLEWLKKKLLEECNEFLDQPTIEELADIMEVVHSLSVAIGSSPKAADEVRRRKAASRGAFHDGILLLRVEEPER